MKQSIKQIFKNISIFLLVATIFAAFGVFVSLDHNGSYEKTDNLLNQKRIISTLTQLKKDDRELALIQFNGKSTQLHNEINKLRTIFQYSFIEQYILDNSDEYLADLNKLQALTTSFNEEANRYYSKNSDNNKEKLLESFVTINSHIDSIIIKSIGYSKAKFTIHKNMTYIAFVLIMIASIIFRKNLNNIYSDLHYLHTLDKSEYKIFSEEADAISLRMNRKPTTEDNPNNIDPVTGINNHKGMLNSYSEKKGMKESNFTSLTVLEIDNFSKSNRPYGQEFTQSILKKVAFTISLHQKSTDVIARTDYNQFTIILSRPSREQSFKDIDLIRQSISEMDFKSSETGNIKVTVSGGFVIKPSNTTLDEATRQAKRILEFSKEHGVNKISQARDLANNEL